MAPIHKVKVLEQCRISPPPGSAARPSLPFTFFDLVFFRFHPVQRILFYELPHSKSHFLHFELPKLKHSLSLTLHHFYPLAGSLTRPSGGQKPEILCSDGDFVRLNVAESGADFYELLGSHVHDVGKFHSLVPSLHSSGDRQAVLAIQATIFPNAGVVVGTTLHHAVADGSTYANFMKTWASMHKFGDQAAELAGRLPFYDRSVIEDSKGLEGIFLKDLQLLEDDPSLEAWDLDGRSDVVRATFTFSRNQLDGLRHRVASRTSAQCSPYAVACGFVWAGLVHARGDTSKKKEHFGFVTGCRARLDPPIPSNYFGNCLGICCVEAKRSELTGRDGPLIAADAIWKVIKSLEEGAFKDAENWIRNVYNYASARALTVAGSPKLGMYEVDFGWGRPRKVEVISIERTGALSLAESREEKGGIEVGLALPSHEMEEFVSFFVDKLSELSLPR
ncbi:anthocyanin 5-aromatic acyltransferase [Elaeis guineensis]|uniref:Anthocyanin 5-aromatic acyltransferase n=1 Tax=Elaeis guineensis var. tenera TaxID=51953 RepID=A0A6I9R1I2_ELAGV|nr:anthocyanin 5-aromatic acyltransferase [Elaeis guineensis]